MKMMMFQHNLTIHIKCSNDLISNSNIPVESYNAAILKETTRYQLSLIPACLDAALVLLYCHLL